MNHSNSFFYEKVLKNSELQQHIRHFSVEKRINDDITNQGRKLGFVNETLVIPYSREAERHVRFRSSKSLQATPVRQPVDFASRKLIPDSFVNSARPT